MPGMSMKLVLGQVNEDYQICLDLSETQTKAILTILGIGNLELNPELGFVCEGFEDDTIAALTDAVRAILAQAKN